MSQDYRRMVNPRGHRSDVHIDLVNDRLSEGWVIDPVPDTRPRHQTEIIDKHKGRPALVVASGPSTGMAGSAAIHSLIDTIDAVVWTTNDGWRCAAGEPVRTDYLVVLDTDFYTAWIPEITEYLSQCGALACLGFDPQSPIDYHAIRTGIADTADTNPPYVPGWYFNGHSSGIAAVQMALHCGCDPILLIGHDCGVANGHTHGMGVRSEQELRDGYIQGREMLSGYAYLAKQAGQLGRTILNLSPVSRIESFRKVTFKEAVHACQSSEAHDHEASRSFRRQGQTG